MPKDAPDFFDAWATQTRPRLLRLAGSWLKDWAEAEDVVQAMLEALWHAHRQGRILSLDAYANRAVWLNAQRRKARQRDWTPLDELPLPAEAVEEPELTPWELEAALAALRAALNKKEDEDAS